MTLRDAWRTIDPADYEAHMARVGQAQANAALFAEWLAAQAAALPLIVAGAGPGQFLDHLPPGALDGRDLTFTDIHEGFLPELRRRAPHASVVVDDLEATALNGPYPLAAIVLVLEHTDWRRALRSLERWAVRRALVVIQENPPEMTSAVTPGLTPPGTMAVFRESAPPHLVAFDELCSTMAELGYRLEQVERRAVAHGKRMVACHFAS